MFELISYKIVHEENKISLRIDISNNSDEEKKVELLLVDSIFGLFDRRQTVNFKPRTIHWVSWQLTNSDDIIEDCCFEVSPLWGANLKLFVNQELNCSFDLKYSISNLDLRLGLKKFSPFNKKKFWIIGDSHPGYYTNINQKNYISSKNYDIVSSSIKSLSLYNFLNSNWKKYLDYLPIFDDDIVAFDFGEIDLRCGILMTSMKKNIESDILLSNLILQYSEFILEMKNNFRKNLVIISPNRPVNDGFLEGNLEYYKLNLSNFSERLDLWNKFNSELKKFCENTNTNYWDVKNMYTDGRGATMNEVLIENDIHFKIKEPMLFELKNKIAKTFPI